MPDDLPIPRKITVLVDTREQRPLLFPDNFVYYDEYRVPHLVKLDTQPQALDAGDYALEGFLHACRVERKGSVAEVCGNLLSSDRRRATASLIRLTRACTCPILLLDAALASFYPSGLHKSTAGAKAMSQLLRLSARHGLRIVFAGPCKSVAHRRKLGVVIAQLLMAAAYETPQALDLGGIALEARKSALLDAVEAIRRAARNTVTHHWLVANAIAALNDLIKETEKETNS